MTHGSDLDLARQASGGDARARDQLLARHHTTIARICRRLCNDPSQCDDVFQETVIAVLRNLGSFRGDASFATWAYTLARTHRGRVLRTDQRHRVRAQRLAWHTSTVRERPRSADEVLARAEELEQLDRALDRLSPVDAEIVRLRDLEGHGTAEVAHRLGLSVSAVKTRLHRARAQLRRAIAKHPIAA